MRIECEDSWLVCDEELMKVNNWTCWDEGIQKDCPKTCGLCSGKLSLLGFAIMEQQNFATSNNIFVYHKALSYTPFYR